MPRQSKLQWELAKTLYMQGITSTEIARQLGTTPGVVRAYACRYKWSEVRERYRLAVPTEIRGVPEDERELAAQLKKRLAYDVERTLKALELKDPARMTLPVLEQRERIAGMVQRRAWATLGMEEGKGERVVNVAVLQTLASAPPPVVAGEPSPKQPVDSKDVESIKYNQRCANISQEVPEPEVLTKDAFCRAAL